MVLSSIEEMKLGKSPGHSNVMMEMLKALPDQCSQLIADLINAILNPSSSNITKWSKTLKQFVGNLPTLKGLKKEKFLRNGTTVIS